LNFFSASVSIAASTSDEEVFPATRIPPLYHHLALFLFLILSLLYFRPSDLTGKYFGQDTDPTAYIWFLNWWPWAIGHGLNPFVSFYVWYPHGFNMTWAAALPLPSLIMAPVTLWFGPVVTFNVLSLLAPALSAWTAYLLAAAIANRKSQIANRKSLAVVATETGAQALVTGWKPRGTGILPVNLFRETRNVKRETLPRFASALIAGYLFGFSSYQLAHLLGHLNLVLTFVVPLLLLLVLKRCRSQVSRTTFVLLFALAMTAQLGLATEILATACFFGGIVWLIFYLFAEPSERSKLRTLAFEISLALGLMLLLCAPFFFYTFRDLAEIKPQLNDPGVYSTDLLNYVLPTAITWLGHSPFSAISQTFTGNLLEQGAYLGGTLILIFVLYFWGERRRWFAQPLGVCLAFLIILSLGPTLQIGGIRTGLWLPWKLALPLPLIHQALPARFTMYVALAASIAVALWLSKPGKAWPARFGLASLACLFLVPNPGQQRWTPLPLQPFFEQRNVKAVLGEHANVLMLPYGWKGPSMLWQLQSGMSFTQSGGYLGTVPESEAALPIVSELYNGAPGPHFREHLIDFCRTHQVTAILIGHGTPTELTQAIQQLGWPETTDHEILVFRTTKIESEKSAPAANQSP
jgi:hypothetical protein